MSNTSNRLTHDTHNPSTARLSEKFNKLRANGLQDVKFWYVGGKNASVEELAVEALSIFEAHEDAQFVDISDKLK